MIEELKKHLLSEGKTDSWLNLAIQFNILPNGTNKQRSDKVRKIFNSLPYTVTDAPSTQFSEGINYNNQFYNTTASTSNLVFRTNESNIEYNYGTPFPFTGIGDVIQPVIKPNTPTWEQQLDEVRNKEWEEFRKWKEGKVSKKVGTLPEPYLSGNPNNVIIISDIHEPFCKKGYLEHCRLQQEVFNCGTVIFIGDVVDNNFSSFHTIDPDGMSAGMELSQAIAKLQNWYKVFPKASVCLANHDRIIARKLFSAGVSNRWMKPLEEVFEVPNWKFVEQVIHNNILYVHGEGGTASKKAQDEMCSVVQRTFTY